MQPSLDPQHPHHHETIEALLRENQRLIVENNGLLRRLNRRAKWALTVTVLWYAILIGAPFVVYYYLLEPYFAAFGSSFSTFEAGLQEIPGWKQFYSSGRE